MNLFYLHLVFFCRNDSSHNLVVGDTLELSNFTYILIHILANLTANWKTRGPTKLVNKTSNTINHHSN